MGTIPPMVFPGNNESLVVGSPNKYLRGPDLMIKQETNVVEIVDRTKTTGRDPVKIKHYEN